MMNFDEIRPYQDYEVQAAIERLINEPRAFQLLGYLFPDQSKSEILARARAIQSVRDLQAAFSAHAIRRIAKQTTDDLSFEGFSYLEDGKGHLFISNHRDILLDSAFLNVLLFEEGFDTVEIGTGNNLFFSPVVTDLMKLNRSFIIHRNLPPRDLHRHSLRLSHYIRQRIDQDGVSCWIAQRNGRAKDGNDLTETGLLKMLDLSSEDFEEGFLELGLIPMAISYEYEPCDGLKVRESYLREQQAEYKKSKKEDYKSMLAGVTSPKGRVHLALGKPLEAEIRELARIVNKNERFRQLRHLIDQRIHQLYRLFPTHYLAADLLSNSSTYAAHYTKEEKERFLAHVARTLESLEGDRDWQRTCLLKLYARPVFNQVALSPT
jgi:hypothetical protein